MFTDSRHFPSTDRAGRAARLRLAAADDAAALAVRADVSLPTLRKLEQDSPSSGPATLLRTLQVLGPDDDIDLLASDDEFGRRLQDIHQVLHAVDITRLEQARPSILQSPRLPRSACTQDNGAMKTSRNDPCPCGSGKKYKHCCLNKQTTESSPQDLTWRRIRRELEGLPARMLNFTGEVYGPEAIDEAWCEFMLWDEDVEAFDPDTPHIPVFMPWFLHCWSPDPDDTLVTDTSLHGVAPTQTYLTRKGRHLAPALKTYLQSCLDHPFSFFEIEQVDPGHGMALRDLLTGERHAVHEARASQSLDPHDVIFGQLACVDDVTMLEATCSIALPAGDKAEVIELRKQLRGSDSAPDDTGRYAGTTSLWDWEPEVRELYLSLFEHRLYPTPPTLVTSDDEAMEFHKLVYDIDSPQQAFDALKHLDVRADDAEALETIAQRDADGTVQRATIDVAKPDQDRQAERVSLLGTLKIDGTRLTAEVNSRERAEWIKRNITEALGTHCSLRADKVQTVEQALAEARAQPSRPSKQPSNDPEAQAMLIEFLESHYTGWLDTPLPALADRTPREVAVDADGREQVAAMLHDAEASDIGVPASARKTIFDSVRRKLGLVD